MKFTCPKCNAKLVFPDEKLKPGGTKFKCGKCGAKLSYKAKLQKTDEGVDRGHISHQTSSAELECLPLTRNSEMHFDADPPPGISEDDLIYKDSSQHTTEADMSNDASQAGTDNYKISSKKIIVISAAAGLLVVLAALFFLSSSGNRRGEIYSPLPAKTRTEVQATGQMSLAQDGPSVTPSQDTRGEDVEVPQPSPDTTSGITDEKAIEIVKKSHALLKMVPVETVVNKWTADNSGAYSIIGWRSKKIDDQKYLVSYTAVKGDKTSGFYFDLDINTHDVQDISHNQELQKKYNIQYSTE